ncbi:MAG: signal peptidase I [Firmicutes bacterium]|nr:signal peptidase I [Bacillota bacterium]
MSKKQLMEELFYIAALTAVFFFLCWPVEIEGGSMENTLDSGDRVALSRVMRFNMFLSNGDLIYCKLDGNDVIKRIIASPNQKIVIEDNKVYVDDVLLEEEYTNGKTYGKVSMTLGDDEYFIMGDHRSTSVDSRTLGVIRSEDIIGRVLFRWLPVTSFSLL